MKISIDVIIPTFRLQEKYILPLLQLKRPQDTIVNYILVVDNPQISVPDRIAEMAKQSEIEVMINRENMGAAHTRNRGFEAGSSDWVLFLDDDILPDPDLLLHFADAIQTSPQETGFIGYIEFPPPAAPFTQAVVASGSMDIFSIALRKPDFAWGATANIMIRRTAVGNVRFSNQFPKKGGGEDVDFFLNIRRNNQSKNFKTLPQARVIHPWWTGQKPDYKRPFRYGVGNSLLGRRHPQNTYYDFLNTPETLFIAILFLVFLLFFQRAWLVPALWFLAGILVIEFLANYLQMIKRRKYRSLRTGFYVTALRFAQEAGVLWGNLSRGEWWRIGERFHDDGTVRKLHFFRLNTYKLVKWILYPVLVFVLVQVYL